MQDTEQDMQKMEYRLLDKINSPADIKGFSIAELGELCSEIRSYILECCSISPGHLASSLGAVELIVGMHYVFDAPEDKLVFDVGHQAYAHKILTGRRELFRKIRMREGISGFPKMSESEYDAFGVGHSSTAVSAAVGMAEASRLLGLDNKVVALVGDGALSGGLAFEGLNNAGESNTDILVILNDNNQSIDGNRGALHNHLLKVTTSSSYNRMKAQVWDRLGESRVRRALQIWTRSLKSWFVKQSRGDIFESLGFRYFGPIDGNDISLVVDTLEKLKRLHGPRLLHCVTVKGRGFAPAEADPVTWHAPGRFNPVTGEREKHSYSRNRYQDVFGEVLLELARNDSKVVGVTPAMCTGCGMTALSKELPAQFFDVGIEEEHAVTFSAGMAASGLKVFCNIYSTFSQRAYDQIIHDLALQRLPVVLCFDRAGLVGEDGATHQGLYDMAAYRSIPGMVIAVPRDELQLKQMMYTAYRYAKSPFIIRYPRGMGEGTDWRDLPFSELPVGKADVMKKGRSVAVIAAGPLSYRALEAAAEFGDEVGVYCFHFIKPLDEGLLAEIATSYGTILTVEDGCLKGGLYGAVAEYLAEIRFRGVLEGAGVPDEFPEQDSQTAQRAQYGIDAMGIRKRLKKFLEKKK